jgi:hypothetical protein
VAHVVSLDTINQVYDFKEDIPEEAFQFMDTYFTVYSLSRFILQMVLLSGYSSFQICFRSEP